MKLTVERTALVKALSHIHRVVERRNTIPILSNVLLAGDGQGLRLKATDLDIEVTETIPADVETSGGLTVPAHTMNDIVRKLSDGAQVELSAALDLSSLSIRAGRSKFTLQALPQNDFPDLSAGETTHTLACTAQELRRLIDKTQFAISTEETRYYLNGIYLHTMDGPDGLKLRSVATDGHRLAQVDLPAPEGAAGMPGIIVPRKTVGELQRLLDVPDAEVRVELSASKIRFTTGTVVLTSKLIDGTFPDYARVIPSGNEKYVEMDRALFAAAVDRVSTVSSERGRAVKLSLTQGKLMLSVTNPEAGSATEEVDVQYGHEPLEIGFNSKYLLDIAGQVDGPVLTMKLADSGAPTLVRDRDADDALYVLMPMRV